LGREFAQSRLTPLIYSKKTQTMFAGKQFDIVMGTDIHLIQPPGPSAPVPVPHPFIGMVFDPPEFIPTIGTILVNGLPRAQAGSNVKSTVPHIPIGGTFVIPPGNDGEVQKGGKSIKAETDPFTYFGAPVLTCNDVGGMPSIARPERHSKCKPKSLLRPTSVLLPVPKAGAGYGPVTLETGTFWSEASALAGRAWGAAAELAAPVGRAIATAGSAAAELAAPVGRAIAIYVAEAAVVAPEAAAVAAAPEAVAAAALAPEIVIPVAIIAIGLVVLYNKAKKERSKKPIGKRKRYNGRKDAEEAARRAGKGADPVLDITISMALTTTLETEKEEDQKAKNTIIISFLKEDNLKI
jgi:hypothetical protein